MLPRRQCQSPFKIIIFMIDTQSILKVREMTGAGMVDVKAALEQAGGEIEKAVEILRKNGTIKAASKSERQTKEV